MLLAVLAVLAAATVVVSQGLEADVPPADALPPLPDPCATLAQWEKDRYAADKAPVDFAALTALDKRGSGDLVRIARAAKYMARSGAFPSAVLNFTPDGLIFREKIDVGVTGG